MIKAGDIFVSRSIIYVVIDTSDVNTRIVELTHFSNRKCTGQSDFNAGDVYKMIHVGNLFDLFDK